MAQTTKEYEAERKRVQRALSTLIYTYHGWEKMPGESDKDFRRRFTKRIVIITEEKDTIILDPFGKVIEKL